MSLIDRAKNILLTPKTEWPIAAAEPATVGGLYTGYAAILALLPLIGGVLGGLVASVFTGLPFMIGIVIIIPIVSYVLGLALAYVVGLIINAVLPSFNGTPNMVQVMKWLFYSSTAVWVAGLFSFIPILGFLIGLAGIVYTVYLMYLGVTPVLNVPQDKAVGFTVVSVLIYIVVNVVVSMIVVGTLTAMFMGGAMMAAGAGAYGA